jgi:hypothetical protein
MLIRVFFLRVLTLLRQAVSMGSSSAGSPLPVRVNQLRAGDNSGRMAPLFGVLVPNDRQDSGRR